MVNNTSLWAVTCMHGFGGLAVSMGTGMSAVAAVAGIAERKPAAVDARYTAQGALSAWSPPV